MLTDLYPRASDRYRSLSVSKRSSLEQERPREGFMACEPYDLEFALQAGDGELKTTGVGGGQIHGGRSSRRVDAVCVAPRGRAGQGENHSGCHR